MVKSIPFCIPEQSILYTSGKNSRGNSPLYRNVDWRHSLLHYPPPPPKVNEPPSHKLAYGLGHYREAYMKFILPKFSVIIIIRK